MYIYRITNNLNGKVYIGQTIRPVKKRWSDHCCGNKSAIGKAIKKYGKENFTFEVLAEAFDMNELDWLERKFIEKFNTMAPNGYNLCGGGRAMRHTEESKRKIGEKNKGKKRSEEQKIKLSLLNKGRKHTEEAKKKISESQYKPIVCIETGVEYSSVKQCAKEMGLHRSGISMVLIGRYKTTKGYTFKYKQEEQT